MEYFWCAASWRSGGLGKPSSDSLLSVFTSPKSRSVEWWTQISQERSQSLCDSLPVHKMRARSYVTRSILKACDLDSSSIHRRTMDRKWSTKGVLLFLYWTGGRMTWSPVSSADETITPVIFIRGALLHFGCLFWGQMLCLAALPPENSKRMDWKCVSFGETRLFFFSPFFPKRSRSAEGQEPGTETVPLSCTESSTLLQLQTHTPTSPPSLTFLSSTKCLTHTPTLRKEKRKTTTMNHSEPTNLSIQLGKVQGETAVISVFKQECRCEGEDQVRVKGQKMGRKSWRRKGFAPCGLSK